MDCFSFQYRSCRKIIKTLVDRSVVKSCDCVDSPAAAVDRNPVFIEIFSSLRVDSSGEMWYNFNILDRYTAFGGDVQFD